MKLSQKGLDFIKYFEGCKLKAYLDPAGIATIGYGNTRIARLGLKISSYQAEALLKEDIIIKEAEINRLNLNLNQNQFDAIVSFVFNLGIGNLKRSTLYKLLQKNPNNFMIAFEFPKWRRANGKVIPGLERRRKREAQMYFTGKGV